MSTYRLYRCNLCTDYIKPSEGANKEGLGVYFVANGDATFKRVSETEKHICLQCAHSVHDELRKMTPAAKDQPHG